jgi:hypothetical protein
MRSRLRYQGCERLRRAGNRRTFSKRQSSMRFMRLAPAADGVAEARPQVCGEAIAVAETWRRIRNCSARHRRSPVCGMLVLFWYGQSGNPAKSGAFTFELDSKFKDCSSPSLRGGGSDAAISHQRRRGNPGGNVDSGVLIASSVVGAWRDRGSRLLAMTENAKAFVNFGVTVTVHLIDWRRDWRIAAAPIRARHRALGGVTSYAHAAWRQLSLPSGLTRGGLVAKLDGITRRTLERRGVQASIKCSVTVT